MDKLKLRRRVASSSFASLAAFPVRLRAVARHGTSVVAQSLRWLATSKEHTNYTYDLTPLNMEHLAWFVADLVNARPSIIRQHMEELAADGPFEAQILRSTVGSNRHRLADDSVHLARRLGWYALIREVQPDRVVETGTDKGLGSCVIAAALLRNGHGRLLTIDINEESGYLIQGEFAKVTDRVFGDSVVALRAMTEPVDVFIHDSLHMREHEMAEFQAVEGKLAPHALVLSDNAHATDALPAWSEVVGRQFRYFAEVPLGHWYPGGGIGVSLPARP